MATGDLQERLQQALCDAYRVERELSPGGMSRLFLATERSLDRQVVIKVLPPEHVSEVSAARFQREITVTAHLQHPHILPVLSAGSKDGLLYYVMPYVEGESLRRRLDREHRLPTPDAIKILKEVADALARAHEAGVVHRDIKPENILLLRDHALLGDFGVARALREATGGSRLTDTATGLGTPGYMAPEQLAGERNVDARADVYALAVVGYEMLAGAPPFAAATPQASAAAHFTVTPKPLAEIRSGVPHAVSSAISRAMAKEPGDRFATAAEFRDALADARSSSIRSSWTVARRIAAVLVAAVLPALGLLFAWRSRDHAAASATNGPISLAVLPFDNLGDAADTSFVDGVTDAVRGKLASLPQLLVIASTSSGQYRHTTKTPQQIGRELGVRYLVIGRVRFARGTRSEDRVQVSPELVDTRTGSDRWQDAFDAPRTDVFALQSNLATRVLGALQIALSPTAQKALSRAPTNNVKAFEAYAAAHAASNRIGRENILAAIALYQRAIALDSNFALAYAELGEIESGAYEIGVDGTPGQLAAAKAAIDRAQQLAPNEPEVALALGTYFEASGDRARAAKQYRAALEASPNLSFAITALGDFQAEAGHWTEALPYYVRAVALDPTAAGNHFKLAGAYLALRDYPAAEREADRQVELEPDEPGSYLNKIALPLFARGDTAAARKVLDSAVARVGRDRMAGLLAYWPLGPMRLPEAFDSLNVHALGDDTLAYYMSKADLSRTRGALNRARIYSDSALPRLERAVAAASVPDRIHFSLALAYVDVGRYRDAVRAAKAGEKAASFLVGTFDVARYLQAYALGRAGSVDSAVTILDQQLRRPALGISRAQLRVDPNWDFLRKDPRFQRLLADTTTTRT